MGVHISLSKVCIANTSLPVGSQIKDNASEAVLQDETRKWTFSASSIPVSFCWERPSYCISSFLVAAVACKGTHIPHFFPLPPFPHFSGPRGFWQMIPACSPWDNLMGLGRRMQKEIWKPSFWRNSDFPHETTVGTYKCKSEKLILASHPVHIITIPVVFWTYFWWTMM